MSYPYTPPPPQYQYGPPPVGYVPPTGRSAIPRVIGILCIVFSVIGGFMTLAMTFGAKGDLSMAAEFSGTGELGGFATWLDIYLVLGLGVFALHLAGGIAALAYRRSAPMLVTVYAIVAILLSVLDPIVAHLTTADVDTFMRGELFGPRVGLAICALPWPIVALIMMNLGNAKRACGAYQPGAE